MQVRWFHSLAFKLFALMTACILLTVAGVTWQNTTTFRDLLDRQLEDTTVARAKGVAADLTAELDRWRGLGALAAQRFANTNPAQFSDFLASLQSSAQGLVAVQILKGPAPASAALRLTPALPAPMAAKLEAPLRKGVQSWLTGLPAKQRSRRVNFGKLTLPAPEAGGAATGLMLMSLTFKIPGHAGDNWVVIAVDLDHVEGALPDDQLLPGWLLNSRTRSVLATNVERNAASAGMDAAFLGKLRIHRSPFGFKAFKSPTGQSMLGAFAQVGGYGLDVIVAQDSAGAETQIMRQIMRTLLWTWLFFLGALMLSFLSADGVTRNLKAVTDATQRIAGGDFASSLAVRGKDEVGILSQSVNAMARQIRELLESKVAAARQEKELETARLVQTTLFPSESFEGSGLSVHARSYPASECGGDWWGHFRSGEHKHYIFIADATGHGVAAALVTAIAYSVCKTLAITLIEAGDEPAPPEAILTVLNRALAESGQGKTTMTFFAAVIDLEANKLTFANAGHNMPFLIPSDPKDERLAGKDANHFKIKSRGTPLGYATDSTFEAGTLALTPGDKLMFYTDGLFECTDRGKHQWREKGMRKSVAEHATKGAQAFHDAVVTDAFAHFGGAPLDDDITLVVVEVAGAAARAEADSGGNGEAA